MSSRRGGIFPGGRQKRRFTDRQIERMKDMRREGLPTAMIGRIMGCSPDYVSKLTGPVKYDFNANFLRGGRYVD